MIERTYMLGGAWVYAKIYTGTRTADGLVGTAIRLLSAGCERIGLIRKWFYVRYRDDRGFHLRLRFLLASPHDLAIFIERIWKLCKPLLVRGTIHTVDYGTYEREIERYGEAVYEETEEIFHADSVCAAKCISCCGGDECSHWRWMCAAAMINDLLDAAGATLNDKLIMVSRGKMLLGQEFNASQPEVKHAFDKKYRQLRSLLCKSLLYENIPPKAIRAIKARRKILKELFTKSSRRGLSERYDILSIIHMTCNRMFVDSNRLCELTLYNLLARYYISEKARIHD